MNCPISPIPPRPSKRLRAGSIIAVGSACFIAAKWALSAAAASSSRFPLSARIALPEPCRRLNPPPNLESTDDPSPKHMYQSVAASLDLLRDNRVVCPNQTPNDLSDGVLLSATSDLWEEYRHELHSASGGWWGGRDSSIGKGLIVFKRGGSGSTWFDTLLGTHPEVDFRHEAHHTVYRPFNTPKKSSNKMRKFLRGEKICQSPDRLCGFSVSPSKHAAGVDWAELVRDTGASLVVFVRTNVLKRILGLTRKQMVHGLPSRCRQGSSYKVKMDDDPNCTLDESTLLPLGKLSNIEEDCYVQSWEMLEIALRAGVPFQILTYEGMQQNLTQTFERLGRFTGWPLSSFDWSRHEATAKVTSDDLRKTILNYDEIEGSLAGKDCFLDMLHSKSKELFPLCRTPANMTRVAKMNAFTNSSRASLETDSVEPIIKN